MHFFVAGRDRTKKGILSRRIELKTRDCSISGSTNTGRASGPQCPILHSPSPIHAEREARRTNATHSDVDPHFRFLEICDRWVLMLLLLVLLLCYFYYDVSRDHTCHEQL